jgi:hypothetical protein
MKTHTINCLSLIHKIIACSPRQLEGEKKTALLLKSMLEDNDLSFFSQKYLINIPKIQSAQLIVDGKALKDIQGCSIIGGKIKGKDAIVSSLIPSVQFLEKANINFNPSCQGISASNHYFAPAIAVNHQSLKKILQAKNVHGSVTVEKIKHTGENILVGNKKNPRTICFAHYDSINMGAVDNASGVAILLKAVLEEKFLLAETLFVFAGSEELSYDKPIYWGYGFRAFEKKYPSLLENAQKIVVIDCVGNGKTVVINDAKFLKLGFPIANVEKLSKKILMISADYEKLMTVYHSDLDDGRTIKKEFLDDAYKVLLHQIQ